MTDIQQRAALQRQIWAIANDVRSAVAEPTPQKKKRGKFSTDNLIDNYDFWTQIEIRESANGSAQ